MRRGYFLSTRHARGTYPSSQRRGPPEKADAPGLTLPEAPKIGTRQDPVPPYRPEARRLSTAEARLRDQRLRLAREFLRLKNTPVTAFDLGCVAVKGERRARQITRADRTKIGFEIALALVKRGALIAIGSNLFVSTS